MVSLQIVLDNKPKLAPDHFRKKRYLVKRPYDLAKQKDHNGKTEFMFITSGLSLNKLLLWYRDDPYLWVNLPANIEP